MSGDMAKKAALRRELLDRWRAIEEEEEEEDDDHSSKFDLLRQLKEQWFADAYNFLICLPKENHIWCGCWEIMGSFTETFYNYFKVEASDSPLKILWERICQETRRCTQCISQIHRAQEIYDTDYESSIVSPLLTILQTLDEERVSQHLKEFNARIEEGTYDPECDGAEVISLMFEVLTFPVLLDDKLVAAQFQTFIEAVDNAHELTLAKQQQFPGVYALLFLNNRRTRSIGLRLAGNMEKVRSCADLEPLQPLLKKCIDFLATEVMPVQLTTEYSRPRVVLDRTTAWLGIKALLGFLEPAALEEGVLEKYPVFLNFVLDHISDDSPEFSHAVICMRQLFEILGYKLWLRTSLPPSVIRDSLLSQCFHTRSEKIHKDIFDLFYPFLVSLEPLQDGEFEKQRRHFLYFLLHQVTRSGNFSDLMRKKACQIALLIVHRGYKMNPPCPPSECAHMWGPSLLTSLRDTALHSSLRQPALDLIQTIIVSEAAALTSSALYSQMGISPNKQFEEYEDTYPCFPITEDKSSCCWTEFSVQRNAVYLEYTEWLCVPMIWLDVFADIDPSDLPVSFSKAVVWALSRFSLFEAEDSGEMSVSVNSWLATNATEVSAHLGWRCPAGSDDGGDGKESKNSVRVSTLCVPLIRTFKRLAANFTVKMEAGEYWRQWTWEPQMGESLILLLADPNDNVRQFGRHILEHTSKTRGLASGLRFLCSCEDSLGATFLGLRHALKLVELDPIMAKFHTLHHFFFVLYKVFKEGFPNVEKLLGASSNELNMKHTSQGGFLQQPTVTSFSFPDGLSKVQSSSWDKFSYELAKAAWPSVKKCLLKGKEFMDSKISQMTGVRVLEIVPIVLGKLNTSPLGLNGVSGKMDADIYDFGWLHDMVDWGRSSLQIIVRYWKQSMISLLDVLRVSASDSSLHIILETEKIVSCDSDPVESLMQKVSQLSGSLSKNQCHRPKKIRSRSRGTYDDIEVHKQFSFSDVKSSPQVDICEATVDLKRFGKEGDTNAVIVLSDDESGNHSRSQGDDPASCLPHASLEKRTFPKFRTPSTSEQLSKVVAAGQSLKASLDERIQPKVRIPSTSKQLSKVVATGQSFRASLDERTQPKISSPNISKSLCKVAATIPSSEAEADEKAFPCVVPLNNSSEALCKSASTEGQLLTSQLNESDATKNSRSSAPFVKPSSIDKKQKELKTNRSQISKSKKSDYESSKDSLRNDAILKAIVHDSENDPLEQALKSVKRKSVVLIKQDSVIPKRKVIQLSVPMESRPGYMHRQEFGAKRFRPPRLEEWFRRILELNYFSIVGLSSDSEDENKASNELKEVPVTFDSPEQYVDIFRPLVLEEFKAQLHSSFQESSSIEEMSCGSISVVSVERIDDFNLIRCVHDENDLSGSNYCSENDLVLLTKQPLQKSPHSVHLLGKVERREKDNKRSNILVVRVYLQGGGSRLNRARKLLLERSKWFLSRIMSITSQLREFQALASVSANPALPVILNPGNYSHHHDPRCLSLGKLPKDMQRVLQTTFNDSQLQAIGAVMKSSGSKNGVDLSLVQGPPGTGKTRTIVAIISAFLALHCPSSNVAVNHFSHKTTSDTNSRAPLSQAAAVARAWQDAALARQLIDDEEKDTRSTKASSRRVLVCAQSNAAVDELVSRLAREGIYGVDGEMHKPYIVRVGNAKTVHPNSLPFFIDTLVQNRLNEEKIKRNDGKNATGTDTSAAIRSSLEKVVDRIRFYESKRANVKDAGLEVKHSEEAPEFSERSDEKEVSDAQLGAKLRSLYQQKKEMYTKLAAVQADEKRSYEEIKALRTKLRRCILREAEIVVATLSGCGGDLYSVCSEFASSGRLAHTFEQNLFDAVVMDEAAQALEPAALIPLQLLKSSGTKCIMVGDPKQLPATVLSNVACKYMYECSMFERLQRAGQPVIMLTKQYRMHPEISHFPSIHFYDGKLLNGMELSSKTAPFHKTKGLEPYVFYDIVDGQEMHGKKSGVSSLYNEGEADAAVEVLKYFKNRYPSEFSGGRIGVITPYKSQLSLLRSRFSNEFGSDVASDMEFNTVDGFQGREVDILLLSTVRSASSATYRHNYSNIGFVADVRRMNVALTRARLSMWIFGNLRTLKTNNDWAALVRNASERNLVVPVKYPYKSMFKTIFRNFPENSDNTFSNHDRVQNESSERTYEKSGCVITEAPAKKRRRATEFDASQRKDVSQSNKQIDGRAEAKDLSLKNNTLEDRLSELKLEAADMKGGKREPSRQTEYHNMGASSLGQQPELGSNRRHSKKQKNGHVSTPPGKGESVSKNTGKGEKVSMQADASRTLISKRKQQRDAVDALLSSALISSKKTEDSSKPLPQNRPSLSSASNNRKPPPKIRKR